MKRVAILILILVVLTTNFTRLFIYAGFNLNKKYIASVLCINKDKAWMNCKGSCYLMKKLKQAEEKEKNQERESQKSHFQEAFVTGTFELNIPIRQIDSSVLAELSFDLPQHESSIFQPPRALSC